MDLILSRNKPSDKAGTVQGVFPRYVEPIVTKSGRDGCAGVHCHSTHTLFNANVLDRAECG
jgi:hypothetical protein